MSGTESSNKQLQMTHDTMDYIGADKVAFLQANLKLNSNILIISAGDIYSSDSHHAELKSLLEEHPAYLPGQDVEESLKTLARARGSYYMHDMDYIYLEDIPTAERAFSLLSHIPIDKLNNVPGTAQDWRFSILAHEIGHHFDLPDVDNKINPENEANADKFQGQLADKAARLGVISTSDLDMATASARAMHYIIEGYKDDAHHENGAAVSVLSPEKEDAPKQEYGLWRAREAIIKAVMVELTTEEDKINAKLDAVWNLGNRQDLGLSEDIQEKLRENYEGHLSFEEKKDLAKAIKVPESRRDDFDFEYESSLDFFVLDVGGRLLERPDVLYATTLKMYKDGAFDTNAEGKEMARNFINGSERYAPEFFKTNGQHTFPSSDSKPVNLLQQNSKELTGYIEPSHATASNEEVFSPKRTNSLMM